MFFAVSCRTAAMIHMESCWIGIESEHITTVVVLAEDSEMLRISGKNLIALYQQQNWRVLHMPVVDFAVPDREELNRTVTDALEYCRCRRAYRDPLLGGNWQNWFVCGMYGKTRAWYDW